MSSQRPRKRGRPSSSGASASVPAPSQTQRPEEEEEEIEVEDSSLTQGGGGTSSSRKYYDQLGITEQKKLVVAMVRYLLCHQGKKVPVKRKELMDNVMGTHKRALPEVLEHANRELESVFGLKAVEIYRMGSRPSSTQAAPIAISRSYVLVSTLAPEVSEFIYRSKPARTEMGLLTVVLSLIMMKQGGISEDQLWNCLGRLGISPERRHGTFGDVKKLITSEFVSQMYLDREKVVTGDKQSYTIRWGPRSKEEVDREALLGLVAEIYEGDIEQWKRQFGDLLATSD